MDNLSTTHLLLSLVLALFVAGGAWRLRMLTIDGAFAAGIVGFTVFCFGGVSLAVPLLAFFFSSSLLSRYRKYRIGAASEVYAKDGTRDAAQVLANGGVAALLALLSWYCSAHRLYSLLYIASLAAVNADTWSTEIGALSRKRPRLLTTLQPVEAGTSGAVSWLGISASLAGALFVVLCAWIAWPSRSIYMEWRPDLAEMLAMGWAGFIAAHTDSLLGATVQALYTCQKCSRVTERLVHCEQKTVLTRGKRWINNDVVNLICSLIGPAFALVLLKYVVERYG